MFEQEYDRNYC